MLLSCLIHYHQGDFCCHCVLFFFSSKSPDFHSSEITHQPTPPTLICLTGSVCFLDQTSGLLLFLMLMAGKADMVRYLSLGTAALRVIDDCPLQHTWRIHWFECVLKQRSTKNLWTGFVSWLVKKWKRAETVCSKAGSVHDRTSQFVLPWGQGKTGGEICKDAEKEDGTEVIIWSHCDEGLE